MPCIYPGPHAEAMSEEHYLPAALGDFEGYEPLLDRVCRRCNTEIGNRVETEFLRTGAIVFVRWLVGISGRDGPPPSPFYRRAAGMPPIQMVGRVRELGHNLLFEVEQGTENVFPLRQVVFEHELLTEPQPVPIHDRMRQQPDHLTALLREMHLENARPTRAFAAPDEIPWVSDLVRGLGYAVPDDWAVTEFPPQRIPLVAEVRVSQAHFRAVAKIGFHYALKMFQDLTGMEREFAPIKDFIWAGGDAGAEARFVQQRADQFVRNFRTERPTRWMHLLAVERTYDVILVHAQFFAGPGILPPPYLIKLGRDPAIVVRRRETRAHQYVYLDAAAGRGEMVEAGTPEFIWVP